ncbi:hypothetical protein UlMin_022029 [Ulmus minor]
MPNQSRSTSLQQNMAMNRSGNNLAHIFSLFLFQFLTMGKERDRKTKEGRSERLVGSDEHCMVAKQLIEIIGKREEFRKQFSKDNPNNKVVSAVGKVAGEKWKSMSDADKAPYVAKAVKRKADYEKDMKAYNKKQAEGATVDEEGFDEKSMSEVNDDDDGSDEEDDDEQELA